MIIGNIVDGIVIDHIPAGRGMELYNALHLDELDCEIVWVKNADSRKRRKKDVLKINQVIDLNYEVLGYIDRHITVNLIRAGKLLQKITPPLPQQLTNIIHCKNPRCITSTEQELPHVFRLTDEENGIYRCIYCEVQAD